MQDSTIRAQSPKESTTVYQFSNISVIPNFEDASLRLQGRCVYKEEANSSTIEFSKTFKEPMLLQLNLGGFPSSLEIKAKPIKDEFEGDSKLKWLATKLREAVYSTELLQRNHEEILEDHERIIREHHQQFWQGTFHN